MEFKEKQKTLFSRKAFLIEKATESELLFKKRLDENNIKYIFQKAFIKGNNYVIVDFYLPKPNKICIEIDGLYHERQEQKVRDYNKDKYLESRGFSIIRIKNEDVLSFDINILKQ
jgi:very-short-patch-repair endonuclease